MPKYMTLHLDEQTVTALKQYQAEANKNAPDGLGWGLPELARHSIRRFAQLALDELKQEKADQQ